MVRRFPGPGSGWSSDGLATNFSNIISVAIVAPHTFVAPNAVSTRRAIAADKA